MKKKSKKNVRFPYNDLNHMSITFSHVILLIQSEDLFTSRHITLYLIHNFVNRESFVNRKSYIAYANRKKKDERLLTF
jgi:hypothetical protein